MSFLRQPFSCLERSHLSPNARTVLNPHVQSRTFPLLRRPFNGTATRLKKGSSPHPRIGRTEPRRAPPDPTPQDGSSSDVFNKGKIVAGSLIGTCIFMFGYTEYVKAGARAGTSPSSVEKLQALERNFVHSLRNWKEGRYYTIITSAFMHKNLFHLYANMVGLWSFGPAMVQAFGVPSFLVLYFGSIITGALYQNSVWASKGRLNDSGIGASGGVLGLVAGMACLMPKNQIAIFWIPMQMRIGMVVAVAVSVAGLTNDSVLPGIGHADHLGGIAFGVLWYVVAVRRGKINFGQELKRWL